MDILEENDDYSNWTLKVTCRNSGCDSKGKITLADVYLYYSISSGSDWDSDTITENYHYICSVCGQMNQVDKKCLPKLYMQDKLLTYNKSEYNAACELSKSIKKEQATKRLIKLKGA